LILTQNKLVSLQVAKDFPNLGTQLFSNLAGKRRSFIRGVHPGFCENDACIWKLFPALCIGKRVSW